MNEKKVLTRRNKCNNLVEIFTKILPIFITFGKMKFKYIGKGITKLIKLLFNFIGDQLDFIQTQYLTLSVTDDTIGALYI